MKTFTFFSVMIVLFTVNSCSNKTNPVEPIIDMKFLECKVTDTLGSPISGVNVHYIPQFLEVTAFSSKPINAILELVYSINEPGYFDLVILRSGSRDTMINVFHQKYHQSGVHSIKINIESFTNGIYLYVLKGENNIREGKYLHRIDFSALRYTNPLTYSNEKGEFILHYSTLGIGEKFILPNNDNFFTTHILSDSLKIVLFKPGYKDLIVPVKIERNSTTHLNFTMIKM